MNAGDDPPAAVPLRAFGFDCVQGLWGGEALWVSDGGSALVQIVRPGRWEQRYETRVSAEQWAEVERLVGAHGLLTLTMPDRSGIPDEARPSLLFVTRLGQRVHLSKWARDAHPDFDAVYRYLRTLCVPDGTLIREGSYEPLPREADTAG